jgi:hypothetical protein
MRSWTIEEQNARSRFEAAGTRAAGVIRCNQPRAMDLNARLARLLAAVPLSKSLEKCSPSPERSFPN